ncbi:nephrocystin-4 [Plakobranchus ocellatus]|uniref:Nephrocystin-4 n=1 Tax=Plakobranchus ocellatus TaxID=259542 RepID=A0AAV4DCD1_9GAST|nr:nephrocystin-4 [Plakobranchus ocellatus]
MASILTGKSWRDFLDKNTHLPAAFDREHAAHDTSSPVCINVKALQGLSTNRYDITHIDKDSFQWTYCEESKYKHSDSKFEISDLELKESSE